ncbi:MAG: diversity-generating retroelement protein Avd, partial [Ardenticatenales bacterium]
MSTVQPADEMVILSRMFDLLTWLVPRADTFPKSHRFLVTQRLLGAALDVQEALFDANARSGAARMRYLDAADAHLDKLRLYLRLAHAWQWLTGGQYRHVSVMVAEVGRLLGGWKRQTAGR